MTRLISGVVLAAAAVAAILFLPITGLRILACGVALLAMFEYTRIVKGEAAGAGVVLVACWFVAEGGWGPIGWTLLGTTVLVPLSVLLRNTPIQSAAATAFGIAYLGLPLGMLVALHARFGASVTLFLIATIVISDSAQYYTGRAFGRRPLAPAISPKKTVEGAVGGVVIATLFVVAAGGYVLELPPRVAAPLGLGIAVLGIAGDLFESRLKREAGLKDSSELIPGHGGVLDRIDALLFAVPVFYVYYLG